MAAFKSLGEKA